MAQPQARVRWMIWLVTGAVITGLGVVLFAVGLDDADKYASVIGALGTLAGFGLSLSALIRRPPQAVPPQEESGTAPGQRLQDSAVGGDAVQIGGVGGNVRIGRATNPPPSSGAPRPPRGAGLPTASPGAQSVTDTQVSGSSVQVAQVAGDVDVDRSA
jgi:hypothetical protein